MLLIRSVLIACGLLFSAFFACGESKTLLLATPVSDSSAEFRLLHLVYKDLFSRIGYQVNIVTMPSARARYNGEKGLIDGQAGRSASYSDLTRHQIIVPEAVFTTQVGAYALQTGQVKISNWEELGSKALQVEYIRGQTTAEQMLVNIVPPQRLTTVTTPERGLKKLNAGRTDLFVATEEIVEPYLSLPEYSDIRKLLSTPQEEIYLFLHESHSGLVSELAHHLKEMKKEGAISRYMMQSLGTEQP